VPGRGRRANAVGRAVSDQGRDQVLNTAATTMSQQYFIRCVHNVNHHVQKNMISLLYELINLRDKYLLFSSDFNFNHSDILTLINYLSSAYMRLFVCALNVLLYEFHNK